MKTLVYVPGCWDVLHTGHLNILESARELGDILVVGVESDELIIAEKGRPPIMPLSERMTVLKAVKYVDVVIPYHDFDYAYVLCSLDADVFVLNKSHKEKRHLEAIEFQRDRGRRVVLLPRTKGVSSKDVRKRIGGDSG